jgi:hypothetical protein
MPHQREMVLELVKNYASAASVTARSLERSTLEVGDELPAGTQLAKSGTPRSKLKVGDRCWSWYKGVVARIVRDEDMPFLGSTVLRLMDYRAQPAGARRMNIDLRNRTHTGLKWPYPPLPRFSGRRHRRRSSRELTKAGLLRLGPHTCTTA